MPATTRERLRISCHLPVSSDTQERVILWFIAYLNQQARVYAEAARAFLDRRTADEPSGFEGFTRSATLPSAFTGYYWSVDKNRVYEEPVALFTIDYVGPKSAVELIDEIGHYLTGLYTAVGTRQDELWIVTHPITQHEKRSLA